MKVDLLDLKAQYQTIEEEVDKAIKDVLVSTHFVMGPNVKKLEEEIAEFTGVKYGIGVANGTDALMLTLKAYGIKENDEVITTPFTFFASAETTSVVGATPVFADIDEKTLCIDPDKIEEKITSRTKAIIPVHIFGQMCDMDRIMEIAEKHNLIVIEDACQAIGAEYKGKKAGSIGHVGCYSFFPTKNLGGYGDGGMIVTNDSEINEKLKLLRVHGSAKKYVHSLIGHNSRLDEIQAAVLRVKLKYITKWNDLRNEKAQIYNDLLKEQQIQLPFMNEDCKHVYHMYSIQHYDRDKIIEELKQKGISTGVYYPIPVHFQEVYEHLNHKVGDFPVAEDACKKTFALPLYPEISLEQQKYVVEAIKEYFN
ncbi:DegT/DnrJ/EryC1/StrS family aminotransferase [Clostridium grantii]|uniref:dTDP-4-amino-4,6-dideoxygalactose transaminase n=1 Tax=Clostridium grantii DSM 8605 TaxID=1121316 RepID=A0A1M5SM45_9CLOT|nr:DegT/DnrJ/EryC1/StrS family aminotransferase [Clostridium grantii]SHH39602.1 dTDP-4-amino-4,6-dideoxygalactose transaminase [Clostridium grantii DSM 8605]